jgi:hypothetical protein
LAKPSRPVFPHRHNSDGSVDSICGVCFATLASEKEEANLEEAEAAHVCGGFKLGRLLHPAEQSEKALSARAT